MSLPNFNFSNSTACDITAAQLQLRCQHILRKTCALTEFTHIISNLFFNNNVHHSPYFFKKLLTTLYYHAIIYLHLYRCKAKVYLFFPIVLLYQLKLHQVKKQLKEQHTHE